MRTETVVRVRGADELPIQTLCPAEPWVVGQPGHDSRSGVLTGWQLYLPTGADVTATDRVRVRQGTYSVLGEPADWAGAGVLVQVGDVWTAECTIQRPGGERGAFDTTTGTYPVTQPDPHYTGLCRVEVMSQVDQQADTADEIVTAIKYLVIVDLATSTNVHVEDVVTFTGNLENGDPAMVGRSLKVRSFARGSMPWQRNLICDDLLAPEEAG